MRVSDAASLITIPICTVEGVWGSYKKRKEAGTPTKGQPRRLCSHYVESRTRNGKSVDLADGPESRRAVLGVLSRSSKSFIHMRARAANITGADTCPAEATCAGAAAAVGIVKRDLCPFGNDQSSLRSLTLGFFSAVASQKRLLGPFATSLHASLVLCGEVISPSCVTIIFSQRHDVLK